MQARFAAILAPTTAFPLGDVLFVDHLATELAKTINNFRHDLASLSVLMRRDVPRGAEVERFNSPIHDLSKKLNQRASWTIFTLITNTATAVLEHSKAPGHAGLRLMMPELVATSFYDMRAAIRSPGRRKAALRLSDACKPTTATPFTEAGDTPDAMAECAAATLQAITDCLTGRQAPCALSSYGDRLVRSLECAKLALAKNGRITIETMHHSIRPLGWSSASDRDPKHARALLLASSIWQAANNADPRTEDWVRVTDRVMKAGSSTPAIPAPDGLAIKTCSHSTVVSVPKEMLATALENIKCHKDLLERVSIITAKGSSKKS